MIELLTDQVSLGLAMLIALLAVKSQKTTGEQLIVLREIRDLLKEK